MTTRSNLPQPTDAELAILNVLWRSGPSTVREVREHLGRKTGYTTVLKMMQIMREKGLVSRDERGLSHIYRAAEPVRKTQEKLVRGLLDRAFEGSAADLMLRVLSARPVPARELKAIRELLEQAEKRSE